jgi:hypothetical protein
MDARPASRVYVAGPVVDEGVLGLATE